MISKLFSWYLLFSDLHSNIVEIVESNQPFISYMFIFLHTGHGSRFIINNGSMYNSSYSTFRIIIINNGSRYNSSYSISEL